MPTAYGPDVRLVDAAYIHPSAQFYGKVTFGVGSSVWPFVAIRAEMHEIRIGAHTNIQDLVMIHVGATTSTIIGDYCSITHHWTEIGRSVLTSLRIASAVS